MFSSNIGMNLGIGFNYNLSSLYSEGGALETPFGYNSMNTMLNGMLWGGSQTMGIGGLGLGGAFTGFLNGFLGSDNETKVPLFKYTDGPAWDTQLASTLGKRDPIYLDINRDNKLNVEKATVIFDINGDGLNDRINEWNSKDAQLVFDANGDGQINNGREIMNDVGINGEQNKYKNGWEKAKDLFDTNKDGKIDEKELEKARFWTDANSNGKVDDGEMKSAADLKIISIEPDKKIFTTKEQNGEITVNKEFGGNVELNFADGFGGFGIGGLGFGGLGGLSQGVFNGFGALGFGGFAYGGFGSSSFNPYPFANNQTNNFFF